MVGTMGLMGFKGYAKGDKEEFPIACSCAAKCRKRVAD